MKRDKDVAFWRSETGGPRREARGPHRQKVTAESSSHPSRGQRQAPALQRIARRRKADPAPISGLDSLARVQVAFYDDVPRFTQSMNALADELEKRVADGVGVHAEGRRAF